MEEQQRGLLKYLIRKAKCGLVFKEGKLMVKKKRIVSTIFLIFVLGLLCGGIIGHNYFKEENQTFEYPNRYPPLGNASNWKIFDSEGIVMVDYGGNLGKQYNPVTVSQYALANYNYYVNTGKKQYKQMLLRHSNWLVEHQEITPKGFGIWYYNFVWRPYQCKNPWVSAMAQGQAVSLLVRAYALTQDKSYLKSARLAVDAFEYSVDKGGVRFTDKDGNVFYLEYASELHPCVLNGFIFSLLGLYDYYQTTGSRKALKLFNEGIQTLEVRLKDYDTGDWTYYDLLGRKASESYHKLHCRLLFELYFITGQRLFLDYAEKWYSYLQR